MGRKGLIFLLFIMASVCAEPPRQIPFDLYAEYTLGGRVPVYDWYIDGTYSETQPLIFSTSEIDKLMSQAVQRQNGYYGATDEYLYAMLDEYASFVNGKKVGIIGSATPWYEAIILAYGGFPITIEYNRILSQDSRCQVMTVKEYDCNPVKFDAILSISSIEHDGLGRYGDPINPYADLETMKKLQTMLNDKGLLFVSIPVGQDAVYWNAHRVYGLLRLPLLFKGWEVVDSSGFAEEDLHVRGYSGHQPVFVLRRAGI